MSKLIISSSAIMALTAIFVIPNAYTSTQIAKASQCSMFANSHFSGGSQSGSFSGSCSTGTVALGTGSIIEGIPHGGSKASCTSVSFSPSSVSGITQDSNGAVSCSEHSP